MTSAPHSPLVERATTAVIDSERTKYPMQRFIARRFAQAALDACHVEELVRLLAQSATELETAAEVLGGQGLTRLASIFTEAASRNRALLAKLEGCS